MKNKFFKKVSLGIILILVLGILSAGCAPTAPPIPPPPATCTLTVYSQNYWCYGYVWINGASTGQWIDFNGSAIVQGLTAGTVAYVQIVDNSGNYSHQEIKVLQSGNNIVIFTYW